MASDSLANALQAVHLDPFQSEPVHPEREPEPEPEYEPEPEPEPKCLPFNAPASFEAVPRYLFRVTAPNSATRTNNVWVKSKDAVAGYEVATKDCFSRTDFNQVAIELNRHLRWWENDEDNFVSWTSSLLHAFQYIFYKNTNERDGKPSLEEIKLCIIDTSKFDENQNVFVQDVDLIRHFSAFDSSPGRGLRDFLRLRRSKFYFGEYLSQGSLKVEGNIQVVPAKAIVEAGLHHLRPKFSQPSSEWAKETIRLREAFYSGQGSALSPEACKAAVAIAELFGGSWKLPIAANFMALLPRIPQKEEGGEKSLLGVFATLQVSDDNKLECSHTKTRVIAPDTLPEVMEFQKILNLIYVDHLVTFTSSSLHEAQSRMKTFLVSFACMQGQLAHKSALLEGMIKEIMGLFCSLPGLTATMVAPWDKAAT